MTRPVVVLRPEPGLSETAESARALGLEVVAAPLFAIEPVGWTAPDPAAFDALIAGSANAFRHAGPQLGALRALPVHAVGAATAAAARGAGFTVGSTGQGGLQAVLDALAAPLRLLRLAGEERAAIVPPAGVTVEECVVYRARALPLAPDAAEALRRGAVALVHSGAAAQHFGSECDRLGIDRGAVSIAALAPAIARAAGRGWRTLETPPDLSDAALLALAARMCQTPGECTTGWQTRAE